MSAVNLGRIDFERHEQFFKTMLERQLIWKRRFIDGKARPWTDDCIFRQYKFTNVYRELDYNSQYCIRNIIKKINTTYRIADGDIFLCNLIWKVLVFRLFNNPETFESAKSTWPEGIPDYWDYGSEKVKYTQFMVTRQNLGMNIFTSAYLIYSSTNGGRSRAEFYTEVVLPKLHDLIEEIVNCLRFGDEPSDILTIFKEIPGVADFIAFELYNDLLYINKFTDCKIVPFGPNDYVNVGPGSKMGIQLIYPDIRTKKECIAAMFELFNTAEKQLSLVAGEEKMPYAHYNSKTKRYEVSDEFNFTISNIEHWLCEYSKYFRLRYSIGGKQKVFKPKSPDTLYFYI